MKTVYVGMDPGKKGFITFWDGKEYSFMSMPTHKVPNGKKTKSGKPATKTEFHNEGLRKVVFEIKKNFPQANFKVAIEQVGGRGGWSATNNFNFGYVAGLQEMIWIMLNADITFVRPQKWQSFMSRNYEQVKKDSKSGKTQVKDPKAMAAIIVETEWPDIDFKKTERSSNVDDNKVDSFLLCNYLIRKSNE